MDARADHQVQYNPYRVFTRAQWATLRDDTPMTPSPSACCAANTRERGHWCRRASALRKSVGRVVGESGNR